MMGTQDHDLDDGEAESFLTLMMGRRIMTVMMGTWGHDLDDREAGSFLTLMMERQDHPLP